MSYEVDHEVRRQRPAVQDASGTRGGNSVSVGDTFVGSKKNTTLGWQPTCSCFTNPCAKCAKPWREVEVQTLQPADARRYAENVQPGNTPRRGFDNLTPVPGPLKLLRLPACFCGLVPCTVLDPFTGSGTAGVVALELGRRFVGIEANPLYVEMAGKRIAESRSRFVSRGDKSGTHTLEVGLWKQAGVEPKGGWYIESGQGMGQTLGIADDRRAYTLTDRATWLAFQKRVSLPILVEKDKRLLNIYSVMEVNPANGPRVNGAGGRAFAKFILAPETQAVIRTFGTDKFGQPLFVPIAGRTDADF